MLEDPDRPAWKADYFVGVPAPAGALLVMLPIYAGFLGVPLNATFALLASGFAIAIALLMVSQLPVYSGKSSGSRIRRDIVMPLILGIVFYVALLFSYTWETTAVTAIGYLAALPLSIWAYARRDRAEAAKRAGAEDKA